ncbi:carbohydrate kinase family protein [Serratia sp. M24T3]|uniref:carbohydrate kinase family protein n=1 Tax=Serratia sp. M24T3 TaxID=932213 RepID=UPI00025B961C|nr:carbohydrate kinase family protein [Serratia sp. M24T3]EIC84207.1 PfkB domain-containing protein [Serratia sp. M24T3]
MKKPETQARLYVVGNLNVDLIMSTLDQWPEKGTEAMLETSSLRPGGSAGNCALALQALDTPYRLVANQGNDQFTPWLAGLFTGSAAHWPQYACETSLTFGVTHPDHERTFFSNQGHIVRLTMADVLNQLPKLATPGDWVLLCGTFLCTALYADYPALLQTLKHRGYQVAVDSGWPPQGWSLELREKIPQWLQYCDALLLNEVETQGLGDGEDLQAAAQTLLALMPAEARCIVKCGPNGAHCWSTSQHRHSAAQDIEVVDTIGAGDSFNAGYLSALLYGQDEQTALRWGVRVASAAIGSSPRVYPTWQALVADPTLANNQETQ